jgi:membrane dipeptidase
MADEATVSGEGRKMERSALGARTTTLLQDALVWDAHAGVGPNPNVDLGGLSLWEEVHVNFLSLNIGYDAVPWGNAIKSVAACRHWLAQRADRFLLVENIDDVLRAKREGKLAIAFDLEGADPLNDQLSMLSLYHRLGVRQMHFAYNLNNSAAGGCHDEDRGLTEYGRAIVEEANRLGILIDLSHSGYRTSMEIMERSAAPVVFSHSNPKSLKNHPRNITNEQILACAATGGIVAVTGVGRFLDDLSADSESFVRAIEGTVELIGVEHVGIGLDYSWIGFYDVSDFADLDLSYWPEEHYREKSSYTSPAQLPEIVELLLKSGYSDDSVKAILGGNYLRVAKKVWKS